MRTAKITSSKSQTIIHQEKRDRFNAMTYVTNIVKQKYHITSNMRVKRVVAVNKSKQQHFPQYTGRLGLW